MNYLAKVALPIAIGMIEHLLVNLMEKCFHFSTKTQCESSSVDRALAFQAEGRGFESRLSLKSNDKSVIREIL